MATVAVLDAEHIEALSGTFSGRLLQPGDDGYEDARKVHNGLIDKRPALIARYRGIRSGQFLPHEPEHQTIVLS